MTEKLTPNPRKPRKAKQTEKAAKAAKSGKSKAVRKRGAVGQRPDGRPKIRIIGPKQLEIIERMYLEGHATYVIAQKFGVCRETIDEHIERHIRPRWKAQLEKTEDQHRAEVQAVKTENWKRYRNAKKEGLADVRWALEQEAKLAGYYAPEKHELAGPGEFRAAGQTPEEAAAVVLSKLVELAMKLKAREEAEGGVAIEGPKVVEQ